MVCVSRPLGVDIVWYVYLDDSLKAHTRVKKTRSRCTTMCCFGYKGTRELVVFFTILRTRKNCSSFM